MSQDVIRDVEKKMVAVVDHLSGELRSLRTGRATTAILEPIQVDYYGTPTPINQVGSLSISEGTTIVIKPWDVNVLKDIEKAINTSDLGLPANNDGKVIRVTIPALTEDRRKALANEVSQIAEQSKVVIRNVRRDGNKDVDKDLKDKTISEDDAKRDKESIQNLTKKYEKKIDDVAKDKRDEILTI